MNMTIRTILFLLLMAISLSDYAQNNTKKQLTADDYGRWNTLSGELISSDGKKVAYAVNPQQGDGNLIFRELRLTSADTLPRGARATFDYDASFLVFHIQPPQDSVLAAKRKKVKKEDMPADSLGIYRFADRRIFRFPDIRSYSMPETSSGWVAFLAKPVEVRDTTANARKNNQKKPAGDDLVLFKVSTADTLVFRRVTNYGFANKAASLVFTQEHKDSTGTYTQVTVYNTQDGSSSVRFSGQGWIRNPILDETGQKLAFLHSTDTAATKVYSLYYGTSGDLMPDVVVNAYTSGLPVGWSPSEHGTLRFSQDGTKLYTGTAPTPQPEPKDTLLPEEKPMVDVWHWNDAQLLPQQKVQLEREKKRTWLAVYHTSLKRFIQLGNLNVRDITTVNKGNGEQALGFDNSPYERASGWSGSNRRDAWLVDLRSGIKRQIITGKSYVQLSPGAKYVVWYDPADSSYYATSTDFNSTEAISLTKIVPVPFYNEKNDAPADPSPYGIAGWAPGDRFVYIYDRYDIWRFDLTGERVPVSMTQAFGRRNGIRFRYIKTDPEAEYIPNESGILLSAFNENNLESGFYTANFSTIREPVSLLMDKAYFSFGRKAQQAEKYLWTREDVTTFPDLWISDLKFGHQQKLSSANPQQAEYNWATAEITEWNSFTGERLKGLLYKPGNFDPAQKYPMVVYFYELLSDGLYRHFTPSPSRSTINRTMYASNGYLVFVPDITYSIGYPGQSAYDAIVSGVNHLVSTMPYVDKDRIGLQGQSWGGYQAAWLITRTNMFAAAMAGAPVSNMTSAYGGIRWETGISRMFQYEQTQSRIGGTLWEKPLHYIENSPLFYAPRIETPLLMMHNDNDGAVPWYQGIEMFVALRRLDKPVWMLNYNNEPHNLRGESWANRMDLDKRMFQFFNHYLKGEPMPEWMQYGIPAIDKGRKLGY
jgi:dipeptidyl aminopeptidase/acylaminoacyl peptidase